jgi:hypothetical protein
VVKWIGDALRLDSSQVRKFWYLVNTDLTVCSLIDVIAVMLPDFYDCTAHRSKNESPKASIAKDDHKHTL